MKLLSQSIFIAVAALGLGLFGCSDEPEIPKEEVALEVLSSDLSALKTIHEQLGVDAEDYPVQWNPEDMSTWKNAGITLDTITDEESQQNYLAVASITVYLTQKEERLPFGLLRLNSLKDLKVYGCAGSYFDGELIPTTVTSLLVDRLNPDDPGYIIGDTDDKDGTVILGRMKAVFSRLIMHGVDMKGINCIVHLNAEIIDLSHNTLEGVIPYNLDILEIPANLSYNRYKTVYWDHWEYAKHVPIVQYNLIEDIPEEILKSDFWKEHHENFIGNPGYKAPEQ